jgi:hypothetical protein
MEGNEARPEGVLLVGSVPFEDHIAVFKRTTDRLGEHLERIPDGETGARTNWIGWQFPLISEMPEFEVMPEPDEYSGIPRLRLKEGVSTDNLEFPPLGYSQAAVESNADFSRLMSEGEIAEGVRFQVSLPTPMAPIHAFIVPEDMATVEPAYERAMLRELDEILESIPHEHLAIQWDTAVEFAILEGVWPTYYDDVEKAVIERLVRLGNQVPEDVELGYHLCYGDAKHEHFKEPEDTALMVRVSNIITPMVTRPINWIHMPVPIDRDDEDYYRSLADLDLDPETELYLGLVHYSDGVQGTRKRIATAKHFVSEFGVATECGFGRRPPETIPDLLDIHAEVAEPVR